MISPPDSETSKWLSKSVNEAVGHIQIAMETMSQLFSREVPGPLDPDYDFLSEKLLIDERLAYANATSHVSAAKEFLSLSLSYWPEGKAALERIDKGLDYLQQLINNNQEINDIMSTKDPSQSKWAGKINELNSDNKRLGALLDRNLQQGFATLNEAAEFNFIYDEDGLRSA